MVSGCGGPRVARRFAWLASSRADLGGGGARMSVAVGRFVTVDMDDRRAF